MTTSSQSYQTSPGNPLTGAVNIQTGNYTILNSDGGAWIIVNSSGSVTITLPSAPPSAIFTVGVISIGTGTTTVDRNGNNINGAATNQTLTQDQGLIFSTDGTNWFTAQPGIGANSPALTGVPTAPTAAPGTNTTQIATCAFVQASTAAAFSAPTIRGSGIQSSSASSYTVSWPTGTVAGDFALIFIGHGWNAITPAGWTQLNILTGSNWNGACFGRVLSNADITAGSVTLTTGGVFNGVIAIITFQGPTAGIRAGYTTATQNVTGAATRTLAATPDGYPSTTDIVCYFGSNRNASNDTVGRGTQRQQLNATAASGCLYTEVPSSDGGIAAPVFSYSVFGGANGGDYQIYILVKGAF